MALHPLSSNSIAICNNSKVWGAETLEALETNSNSNFRLINKSRCKYSRICSNSRQCSKLRSRASRRLRNRPACRWSLSSRLRWLSHLCLRIIVRKSWRLDLALVDINKGNHLSLSNFQRSRAMTAWSWRTSCRLSHRWAIGLSIHSRALSSWRGRSC